MSRKVPAYRRHPNGQAFICTVRLNDGKAYYLGKFGTPASKRKYQEILKRLNAAEEARSEAENALGSPNAPAPSLSTSPHPGPLMMAELIDLYTDMTIRDLSKKEHMETIYSIGPIFHLFGTLDVDEFTASHLEEVQRHMITLGWVRKTVNRRITRIKRMVRWGSKRGHCPPTLYHALLCVDGLKRGQWGARDNDPVEPVSREVVDATIPWMKPDVAAMVRVQLLCGMRSQDICGMRPMDINMSGEIWIYSPPEHKTAHLNKRRIIAIPKTVQGLLKPLLHKVEPDQFVFSPRRSELARQADRVANRNPNRQTPIYPSELRASAKAKIARRQKESNLRDRYDSMSYRQAIDYAIDKAARANPKVVIPHWHPHQLRHTISTEISQAIGEQQAQRWLGHERLETTGIYTQQQVKELVAIAKLLDREWSRTG